MTILLKIRDVLKSYSTVLENKKYVLIFLALLAIYVFVRTAAPHDNNFRIFYHSYLHLAQGLPLHIPYPDVHHDLFYYNPVFATLIAPFTLFSIDVARFFWITFLIFCFAFTLSKLPFSTEYKFYFFLLVFFDFLNNLGHLQANIPSLACMVLCWVYFDQKSFLKATFFAVMAFAIKGYAGIICVLFLFGQIKDIIKSLFYGIFWMIFIHALPLVVVGSLSRLLDYYQAWLEIISSNTIKEQHSFFGIVKVLNLNMSDQTVYLIAGSFILVGLILQKFYIKNTIFIAAWLMITIVLFNQSAESPTYIYAVVGMVLIFLYLKNRLIEYLFWIAMAFCTLFPVGIIPLFDALKYQYYSKAFSVLVFLIGVALAIFSRKTVENKLLFEY